MSGGRPRGGGLAGRLDRARGPVDADTPDQALWRALDFHATPPWATRAGAEVVGALDPGPWRVGDPCCGHGHMAYALSDFYADVLATDLHSWGSRWQDPRPLDFLGEEAGARYADVDWLFMNPPNRHAGAFVRLGLQRARRGVAVLTRLTFLDSIGRYPQFFDPRDGLAVLASFAERVPQPLGPAASGGWATPSAWFVWMKPQARGRRSPPIRFGGGGAFIGIGIPPGTEARLTRPGDATLGEGG